MLRNADKHNIDVEDPVKQNARHKGVLEFCTLAERVDAGRTAHGGGVPGDVGVR